MWIDFEGIDGSGKSTLSVRVTARLRELGLPVHHVRENGVFRSRIAGRIRELTRDGESALLAPETELLLNSAREAQLLAEEIRPALSRGRIVVTDRALPSHEALARSVRGLSARGTRAVVSFASGGLWPDAVVYVDIDPEVARWRKRLRKIRERRFGPPGRKGLLGQAFPRMSREAFLACAAREPSRWLVLDNSFRSLADAEREALALLSPLLRLSGPPRRPPPPPLRVDAGASLQEWTDHLFDFAERLAALDAPLSLLLLTGIDHPRADALRRAAAPEDLEVAVWSMSGLNSPAAWELRERGLEAAPFHVARSLRGLDTPEAWALRDALKDRVPGQVLHSLGGLPGERACALRRELWDRAPEEGLRSLAGQGDEAAWELRRRAQHDGLSPALADSLGGLDDDAAWDLRDRLRPQFPVAVLRSLRRLEDERSWPIREELIASAPRAVMESIHGLAGARSDSVRDRLQQRHPDEVAASLAGLDDPGAWKRRHELLDASPVGVISSLQGFAGDPLATAFVENALLRGEGQPRLVRKAALFHLDPEAVPEAS